MVCQAMNPLPIAGFITTHNVLDMGYPMAACIRSLLPVCQEALVLRAQSRDGSVSAAQQPQAEFAQQVRVERGIWKRYPQEDFTRLSRLANQALLTATHNWVLYLQAEEVLDPASCSGLEQIDYQHPPWGYSLQRIW